MDKALKVFSVILLMFCAVVLPGKALIRPDFSPVKAKFRLLPAPRIKAGSVSSVNRGSLSLMNRRWGVVEITFEPHLEESGKSRAKSREVNAGAWLDDVVCGVRVIAGDIQSRKNPSVWGLFSTRVEFWTIPLDWKEHKYFVYLPPMLIERVMPFRKTDSKQIRMAADNNFIVCVTFFHKKWGVIGEGFYGLKDRTAGADFRTLVRFVPQNNIFHGALVSRANSPWGVNDQDQFDLEKPAFIPAPLDDAAIDRAAEAAANEGRQVAEAAGKSATSGSSKKNRKSKK